MQEIIETLKGLAGHRHLQAFLREKGLGSGVSWDGLTDSVRSAWNDDLKHALLEMVEDLRLHGRNHVFLFEATKPALDALRNLNPNVDETFAQFPLLTPDLEPSEPRLTAIRETETHRLFVFCSHRVVRHEEPLDRQFLDEDAPEEIKNADEIKYITKQHVEAVDVVAVPLSDEGLIEIRVDLIHSATEPKYRDAATAVRNEMRAMLGQGAGRTAFQSPVDLAPAMARIYAAGPVAVQDDGADDAQGDVPQANVGRVYEMAFQCGTDVRRREVMQKYDEDLRTEGYHVAGMEAIGNAIEIYRLGVHWVKDDSGSDLHDAFLLLPGTLALLKVGSVGLFEVRVPRSVRRHEYRFMMEKLAAHVRADDEV